MHDFQRELSDQRPFLSFSQSLGRNFELGTQILDRVRYHGFHHIQVVPL
jgi:hypothetical protein